MYPYFVRVYHHKDGSVNEIGAYYAHHDEAKKELNNYIHMDEVSFAKIEEKYSPVPIFT